jgi:hypothetical protein
MGEISERLVHRADGEMLRHRTVAQSLDLREDEPHPVRPLRACHQFGEGGPIDGLLACTKHCRS